MPSKILLKKASPATSGREPSPSDLDAGELAINSTDGRLFSKREDGTIIEIGASIPVGSMIWFAGGTAPLGWLVMNGDPVSAAFPDLRAHLVAEGYPFGTDGTDPLLPDLMTDGLFVRSLTGSNALGTEQGDAIRNIVGSFVGNYANNDGVNNPTGAFSRTGTVTSSGDASGGLALQRIELDASGVVPTANETRPKNIAMLPCIKAYSAALNTGMADLSELLTAIATQGEAEAGTDNTKLMTPLRSAQAIAALAPVPGAQCVAWVNFNGTGTVEIRASYNVSSITDNGTGDFTLNFATALSDANYCVTFGTVANDLAANYAIAVHGTGSATLKSTTQLRVMVAAANSALALDLPENNVAIFR